MGTAHTCAPECLELATSGDGEGLEVEKVTASSPSSRRGAPRPRGLQQPPVLDPSLAAQVTVDQHLAKVTLEGAGHNLDGLEQDKELRQALDLRVLARTLMEVQHLRRVLTDETSSLKVAQQECERLSESRLKDVQEFVAQVHGVIGAAQQETEHYRLIAAQLQREVEVSRSTCQSLGAQLAQSRDETAQAWAYAYGLKQMMETAMNLKDPRCLLAEDAQVK
eukprot:gnl/TRDRNA2_/TRDRNA2_193369_c0_seq1.p1 gnl/TRDRNA2_/TRDRNA2_193369_c0~~gnl/TRDRNA2_/TRDRNA2_193369_c0_seq1.p1  ORF type:complete len:235 (-),score=54.19 gnl/TRDRNA2_/TRDRNA2_193369_c0_seq1:104-769(-)